ncbi:16S rRNA (guanine(527)-N(7))-methyltransferase RsmG [Fodinicurvata sediminis]|uniref:16S rRNA (guanine(527)-N(7))-methyltransferase RsmG n=1 Tax=Fodinicurvata sediminis TaxID=1121832 RepID=UPI0003B796C4|nr:16S rRNA (guanine(527)-N(7))-methyltransferase RsmG [Fodinicurvata sediminis]
MTCYTENDFARDLDVSRETLERFRIYATLLEKWNARINLVGRATVPDLWRRHFLDSAQLLSFLPDAPRRVLDLGSGAGFPGLVLSLLGAGEVHLVESDTRKCTFLREVSRETGSSAIIHNQRIESMELPKMAYVTARACASLERLVDYARPHLMDGGYCLFLKGASLDEELTLLRKAGKMPADPCKAEVMTSRSDKEGRILRLGPFTR